MKLFTNIIPLTKVLTIHKKVLFICIAIYSYVIKKFFVNPPLVRVDLQRMSLC